MSGKHAKLSPSSSDRWLTCPGSVKLIESLNIKEVPKLFAAEGTAAHEVHELALRRGLDACDFIGDIIEADGFKIEVTEEMAEAVQKSLDHIYRVIKEAESKGYNVEVIVEKWVSLKHLNVPGLDGGTSDVILIFRKGKKIVAVVIVDYKHGKGVKVYPENNTQMLCYGAAAVNEVLPKRNKTNIDIIMTINQPRLDHIAGWAINREQLEEWIEEDLVPGGMATTDDDAEFVPSEKGCRFCPAKPNCKALYEKTQDVAVSEFQEFALPEIEALTPEQKINIVKYKSMLTKFFEDVEASVNIEIKKGSKDYAKELKMVRKQSRSKLTTLAFDELGSPLLDHLEEEDLYKVEKKQKGIGDIKAALKAAGLKPKEISEVMEEVTEKPEGELVVVPISDKRKAVPVGYIADFDGMEDTDETEL